VAIAFDVSPDLLDLNDALDRLALISERQAHLVELRYFGGLSIEEACAVLDVSHATLERDWSAARLWLRRQLSGAGATG
ncbi:MAG: RNA polymerase subunit sigma, partial [Xanthomonadales bacterium]|nr:RNA polymerase subunit sigma [Xanthomonadales bacterium]MCB1578335.1 RNA polymerase subunit sigma [Xanthomonadales bacterium]